MKHILFFLFISTGLLAQSPRLNLKQLAKDTTFGSVLISNPSDSGIVFSRDFYISYGADTFLILGADTVTLQSDLVAEIADSLLNYVSRTELSDSTTNIRTDIPLIIADSLLNYVSLSGTQTITGAKTFTNTLTQSGGDVNFDSGTFFVDEDANKVGIGTSTPSGKLNINGVADGIGLKFTSTTDLSIFYSIINNNTNQLIAMDNNAGSMNLYAGGLSRLIIKDDGKVGINTPTPSYKLDVNGDVRADTYYYDVTSTLQSSSDSRLKQNITDMDNVLDKLKELELVKYEWNDNMYKKLEGRTSQSKLGGTFEGMIAQQVESLFPQYVGKDADGYKTLSYVSFVIPLLKGFQEQQAIIESQANEIEQLKTLITDLSNRLQILENN